MASILSTYSVNQQQGFILTARTTGHRRFDFVDSSDATPLGTFHFSSIPFLLEASNYKPLRNWF
jgi:hypothetical protein